MFKFNLLGQTFSRLTVLRFSHKKNRQSFWICICECGNDAIARTKTLRNGRTRSCGCLRQETARLNGKNSAKHNMSRSSTYQTWASMHKRCKNKKNKAFKDYGGRGIKICEKWNDFNNFYADMGDKPNNLSIDRINNNGNYKLSNCRWATALEQANNKRNNKCLRG